MLNSSKFIFIKMFCYPPPGTCDMLRKALSTMADSTKFNEMCLKMCLDLFFCTKNCYLPLKFRFVHINNDVISF